MKSQNIEILEFFLENMDTSAKFPLGFYEMSFIIYYHSLEFLAYIVKNKLCDEVIYLLAHATETDCGLSKVMFLHSLFPNYDIMNQGFIRSVFRGGNVEVWKYFYGNMRISFNVLLGMIHECRSEKRKEYNRFDEELLPHICEGRNFTENELNMLFGR